VTITACPGSWPLSYLALAAGDDLLLFSAGGNDVRGGGQLTKFLNLFDVDNAKPADAAYYVNQDFFDNLDMIVSDIETGLIMPMVGRRTNKKIIMHGYDYVIPRAGGWGRPWSIRVWTPLSGLHCAEQSFA